MENHTDRTAWMAGHYGIMVHWLYPVVFPEKGAPPATLDQAVDQFDLEGLMAQFAATGADWFLFTIGQNSGFYASPNAVIERLAGPGHCSRRDLVLEIATAVHRMGKRFIAYLPCEVAGNKSMHAGFAWNTQPGTDQAEFQRRYLPAVREWAERFGPLLDGWWFDGCYKWPAFDSQYMDWPAWYAATRAGNPDCAVAFNDGSLCGGYTQPVTPEQDYIAGETEALLNGRILLGRPDTPMLRKYGIHSQYPNLEAVPTFLPDQRFVPGTHCQWHSLLPIDSFWGHGNVYADWLPAGIYKFMDPKLTAGPMEPPCYSDDELAGYLNHCLKAGGSVTMNMGIYLEGRLGDESVQQLARISPRILR
jgi:hypothetical protein